MAREFILRASIVSADLTRAASAMILSEFSGFYATEGAGGYTFEDGRKETAPAMAWHIGTAAKDSERFAFVARFACFYCKAGFVEIGGIACMGGNQESIYFLDSDGAVYLVFSDGRINPII